MGAPTCSSTGGKTKGVVGCLPAGSVNQQYGAHRTQSVTLGPINIRAITGWRTAKLLAGQTCQGLYLGPGTSSMSRWLTGEEWHPESCVVTSAMEVRYRWIKEPLGPNSGHGEHAQRAGRVTEDPQP